MKKHLKFIDLFAGIGGFHHAAIRHDPNMHCVLAVEWDKDCQAVYSASFPGTPLQGDIRKLLETHKAGHAMPADKSEVSEIVPDHNILFAGFPCQPFSKGGEQLGLSEDTQGTLFHEIMRIVKAKRPSLLVLENVANLVSHDEGRTWETIIRALISSGYDVDKSPLIVSPHNLKKSAGGAPQNRPRVYILAADKKKGLSVPRNSEIVDEEDQRGNREWDIRSIFKDNQALEMSEKEVLWLEAWDDFVKGIPDDSLPGFPIWVDAWFGKMRKPDRRAGSVSTITSKRFAADRRGEDPDWWKEHVRKNEEFFNRHSEWLTAWHKRWDVEHFPESRRKLEWQARRHHPTASNRTIRDCLIQMRPSGIRVKPPTYAPALVAMAQTPVIGDGHKWRKIGPEEAGMLQGFSDFRPWKRAMKASLKFKAGAAYKQFGNAVNVGVAQFVLRKALSHLDRNHDGWRNL